MRPARPRRTCHAVPGSSERFLAKAPHLDADEVFLDLEDAVAPAAKEDARVRVIEALRTSDFGPRTVVVRVNGTDTPYYYRDLIAVVEQAGGRLDAVMLPKVRTPGDVEMTDKLLTQIERASGLESGRIGIEAQIEDATGLIACEAIATASARMETLIFGPGDYSAAVGIPVTTIGAAPAGYPGDHLNHVYSRLVIAARAAGIQVIDGPYAAVDDEAGRRGGSPAAGRPRRGGVGARGGDARGLRARERRRGPRRRHVRRGDDRRGQPADGGAAGVRRARGGVRRLTRARASGATRPARRAGSAAPAWPSGAAPIQCCPRGARGRRARAAPAPRRGRCSPSPPAGPTRGPGGPARTSRSGAGR